MIDKALQSIVDELYGEMVKTGRAIFDHPETGLMEYESSKRLSGILKREGFDVQVGLGSLPTAFKATKKGGDEAPHIAFLAEYDALPEVGHGCGHNLVGTGAVFAAVALTRLLPEFKGRVSVIGTPAEEDKGGKIILLEEGFFDDVDIALMAHPSSINQIGRGGRAITSLTIKYEGKQAHSANPSRGINALSAVIQTFNGIDANFQRFPRDVNTNGIILEGGTADNIIPGYASCRFSVRGATKADVETAVSGIRDIVASVEVLTGAEARIGEELIYAERYPNMEMEERYGAYLSDLGETVTKADPEGRFGSSDIGNISLAMPAMHPYFSVTDSAEPPLAHTVEYGEMCNSDRAYEGLKKNVIALASLGRDLLADDQFRASVLNEFKGIRRKI
ncbi:M20 family metallopeptidase [Spirochaeta isovalerica]|uniref:Peptidase M20 domain-containing protein 2 n=1 Tax=Spirochaeta isovalerica TaxID=150 RepID=A0A841RAC0_9SPIO|nr:M20 family metallopeptidase [Spirochaeta isovalerica]MBB6479960.1 amidohydrolase [Spirochaeta isovalerica]